MTSKVFHLLFVHVDLYCLDLNEIEMFEETNPGAFSFLIIKDVSEISKLQLIVDERGEKFRQIIQERLRSGNFSCFCFVDKKSGNVAYSRWLRRGSFQHERFKKTIRLAKDEAFTMDSYTAAEFRGLGLHKEMNRRMLNYCKRELKIHRVFMVILRGKEYSHLHRIVRELGYRRIQSRFYFRTESVKALLNRVGETHVQVL